MKLGTLTPSTSAHGELDRISSSVLRLFMTRTTTAWREAEDNSLPLNLNRKNLLFLGVGWCRQVYR